ncbi:MAG: hypothetical protein IKV05_08150 [Bacteroidales bacterium]|nr:hypothetical protein [Bacteroidales bacterium]
MKRITYIIAFTAVLAASCQKNEFAEEPASDEQNYKILTAGITDEPQTRVGFNENNSFYWHKGDQIGVLTSGGLKVMTLDAQYHKQPSGVFYGSFTEDFGEYAVYPYGNHLFGNGQLTFILPSSYTYTSIEADTNSFNPPMLGKIIEGNTQLNHLASFLKITATNIPAGGENMKFILTSDKRITGEFIVDLAGDAPMIITDESAGNTVTIYFTNTTAGATGTFYIPVPVGSYDSITAEIKVGDILLASKTWNNQVINRATPKRGTMEVDYIAEIDVVPFGSLQDAIDAADNQTITLVRDLVLESPLEIVSGKTVTLDLNGHTLSETATSAAASCLIAVKSGGNLTIQNGTIVYAATTPDTGWGGEGQPPYPGYANNTIRNEGTLVIENATIENKTSKGGASYVIDNYAGANLTINEGAVLTQSGGDIAIRMFNGGSGAINVTINGGTISGYRAVWVQLASNNTAVAPIMNLTVTGGTLTSTEQTYNQAIYSYSYGNDMRNVLINVSGGTFNGDIALTGGANKTNLETLNISGGQFNGQWGFYSYGADEKALEAITVTGGTFMTDPSYYLDPGYTAVETDGKWTVVA